MSQQDPRITKFLQDHTFKDRENRLALLKAKLPSLHRDITAKDILNHDISEKNMEKMLFIDERTNMVMIRVKVRFLRTIEELTDNLPRLFLNLRQLIQEDAIKLLFPEAWDMYNEMVERKARTTARCQKNRIRNEKAEDHREAVHQTRAMSVREGAAHYGNL